MSLRRQCLIMWLCSPTVRLRGRVLFWAARALRCSKHRLWLLFFHTSMTSHTAKLSAAVGLSPGASCVCPRQHDCYGQSVQWLVVYRSKACNKRHALHAVTGGSGWPCAAKNLVSETDSSHELPDLRTWQALDLLQLLCMLAVRDLGHQQWSETPKRVADFLACGCLAWDLWLCVCYF